MVADSASNTPVVPSRLLNRASHARLAKYLLSAFCLCWMFDLRAKPEERWLLDLQLVSFSASCLILAIAASLNFGRLSLAKSKFTYAGVGAFLIVTIASGLFVWHNPQDRLLPNTIPFLVLLGTVYLVDVARGSGVAFRDVFAITLRAAMISTAARVAMVFLLRGIDVMTVRYEILSGAAVFVSAYLLTRLVIGIRVRDMLLAAGQIAILALSVTRSGLFAPMAGSLLLFGVARRRLARARGVAATLAVVGCLGVVAVGVLYALPEMTTARWGWRLSLVSSDPYEADFSILARRALLDYQWQRLSSSPYAMALGFGIAADEQQTGTYEAIALMRGAQPTLLSAGFADNTYSSALYLGGIVGGGGLLLAMASWGMVAFRVARRVGREAMERQLDLLVAPVAIIITLISLAFAPISDRMVCLYLGLALAMTLWTDASFRPRHVAAGKRA